MDSTFVLSLDAPQATAALFGGKGINLNRLFRRGFLVPPGFVISSEAYDAFARYNQLDANVVAAINARSATSEGLGEVESEARRVIQAGLLPDELASAIQQAYRA